MIASFATKEQESYAKAGSIAEEVLSCVRTVFSFGGEQKEIKRYEIIINLIAEILIKAAGCMLYN